jgi:hypothetical protein
MAGIGNGIILVSGIHSLLHDQPRVVRVFSDGVVESLRLGNVAAAFAGAGLQSIATLISGEERV